MKQLRLDIEAEFDKNCKFCKIIKGDLDTYRVFQDKISVGILDHRPLFPGYVLLLSRENYTTIEDLPQKLIEPFFANVQLMSKAVEEALNAQGTFVAINNRVSQSVMHLHVHIVPRKKGDGLRGFFWPRKKYPAKIIKLKSSSLSQML